MQYFLSVHVYEMSLVTFMNNEIAQRGALSLQSHEPWLKSQS